MRVLIVDDSTADRKLCKLLLAKRYGRDIEFIDAADGAAALALCQAATPDCILLEYVLPDMTGLEFLALLRGVPAIGGDIGGSVAVVMLSDLSMDQVAVDALRAGAQDFLAKDGLTAESLCLAVAKAADRMAVIRELRLERDRMARSLEEKEVLLREIHHRVKNNLQVISSLLRLQAERVEDEKAARALRDSRDRVESMALIHEQLYDSNIRSPDAHPHTKDLREVDLAHHAALLIPNLMHSYGVDPARIVCRTSLQPTRLTVDRAIPAGLILNELISNALRHAFPENRSGAIEIAICAGPEHISLIVEDDGIGLAGPAETSHPSLGLQIVEILTRQLKGRFVIEGRKTLPGSDAASGTVCRVTFPRDAATEDTWNASRVATG